MNTDVRETGESVVDWIDQALQVFVTTVINLRFFNLVFKFLSD
jgi:hypothetical protein